MLESVGNFEKNQRHVKKNDEFQTSARKHIFEAILYSGIGNNWWGTFEWGLQSSPFSMIRGARDSIYEFFSYLGFLRLCGRRFCAGEHTYRYLRFIWVQYSAPYNRRDVILQKEEEAQRPMTLSNEAFGEIIHFIRGSPSIVWKYRYRFSDCALWAERCAHKD